MYVFRIADRRRPLFDGMGAFLHGGRWNSPGLKVIYAAETYAGALLEILVHAQTGQIPKTHSWVQIQIPDRVQIEEVSPGDIPGWASARRATQTLGDKWLREQRSVVLAVPSVVTAGVERNYLFNPSHPHFELVTVSSAQPVIWDTRLWGS